MNLWSRPAVMAYLVAFVGMAGFDLLWDAVAPDLTVLMKTTGGDLTDAALRRLQFSGAVLPWAEMAAIVVILACVLRIGPALNAETGFSYVVLVTFILTLGRELLGTRLAFEAPFGFRVALAWLIVLGATLIRRRHRKLQ